MPRYTILRSTLNKESWNTAGYIVARTKNEAIKKMIQELPKSQKGWEYVALSDSDKKWVSGRKAEGIKKTGKGKI